MSRSSEDIANEIRPGQEAWNAAFNRGDAAAVAALYLSDATLLPPTHAVIKGTTAIREFWQGLMSAGFDEHGIETLDAGREGNLAFAAGKWWANGPAEGGARSRFEGTVVTVLRRDEGGAWKIVLHTWN